MKRILTNAKQLAVHISERDQFNGRPLYEEIVDRFNAEGFAGVTVHKALEGFGAHHEIRHDRLFAYQHEAPIMLVMVDSEEHVRRAQQILGWLLTRGVAVVRDVEASLYAEPGDAGKGSP